MPTPPRNEREAAEADDFALQTLLHVHALNRQLLLTLSHNMALMAPTTTEADVDAHTGAFLEVAGAVRRVEPVPGARSPMGRG